MDNDILLPETHIEKHKNAEDGFSMNEALRSIASLTISEKNGEIRKKNSRSEVAEAGEKNYEELVSDLIKHTADESNLETLKAKMDDEVKNVLKTKESKKQVNSDEKSDDIQPRDPRIRERIMSYLAKASILVNCSENKCNAAEPSMPLLGESEQSFESDLKQDKQLSGTLLQEKGLSRTSFGQNEQLSGTPVEKNNFGAQSNEDPSVITSDQNEVLPKISLNQNFGMKSDNTGEINPNTTHSNITTTKHNFNKFRRNIKGKYNQSFYSRPRNTMLCDNRRPYYSNENRGRYFNINRHRLNNSKDIKQNVESMFNLLDNTSSSSLSSSPEGNLKNSRSRVSLRLENREKQLANKLKCQTNKSAKPSLANRTTEDLNNEVVLNIMAKLNKFHTTITHQNEEEGHQITDETQILQKCLPYQNPVESNQTKDILIILNEDRKKIINLENSEGFLQLSQKLINSLQKDKFYKDFVNRYSHLNYQMYNSKFKEWVDIDDVDSFELHDGVRLKLVVDKLPKKRKRVGENHEKEKKVKHNEDQSKNLREYESDLSDTSKRQTKMKYLENKRDKLFEILRNDKFRNIQINKDLSQEETDSSEDELSVIEPPTNFFDEFRTFLQYFGNEKKNILEDSEKENSKRKIGEDTVSDKCKENTITRIPSFKLIIPDGIKEALLKNFEMKPKHPVQQLVSITNTMRWGIPKFDLVHEGRNADNTKTFAYSVTINGIRVVKKGTSNNKKNARKVAAEACLKKLGFAQICND